MARKKIGEILVQAGVLDNAGLRAALIEQRRWGGQIGRILVDMKLVREVALVKALSHQLNFPIVDLDHADIDQNVLDLVAPELAEQHGIVPFQREGKFLDVAMSDPTNLGIIDELRIRTQLNVRPYLAGPKMIERAIGRCYGRGMGVLHVGHREGADISVDIGGNEIDVPTGDQLSQSQRRAQMFEMSRARPRASTQERDAEVVALQDRISRLEALVKRDEDVLRKLLGLLVDKGVATREEILERIK